MYLSRGDTLPTQMVLVGRTLGVAIVSPRPALWVVEKGGSLAHS